MNYYIYAVALKLELQACVYRSSTNNHVNVTFKIHHPCLAQDTP